MVKKIPLVRSPCFGLSARKSSWPVPVYDEQRMVPSKSNQGPVPEAQNEATVRKDRSRLRSRQTTDAADESWAGRRVNSLNVIKILANPFNAIKI